MSIENRNQLYEIINLSRESRQCRVCIGELSGLSEYHHSDEVLKAASDLTEMLEKDIYELHKRRKELEKKYLGPDPAEEALKGMFTIKDEEEEE